MKSNNKIFGGLLSVLLAFLTVTGLVSCSMEEVSTDQFSDEEVRFSAFAPNPVARGGALRLIGSNLQKVTQVEIPGVEPITDIEVVTEGRMSEIRIIVPVDGPEIGPVSIVAGSVKCTSKADLEYSEPIVFDGFSPASAMPGDVITFKGDYMNNIRQVIFEGNAVVTEFESQSRRELKVKVPSNAITGKVILGDVDENNNPDGLVSNLFYSETDLAIGDPSVKSSSIGVLKSGDEVIVTGSYLDMIESVNFGGVDAGFTVSQDGKSITTSLPATATDGDLVLVSFAGKEFKAGAYETLVPSALSVSADKFKAGAEVTLSGKDLDLVTGATLSGTTLSYTYDSGKISFQIPAEANDGTVLLSLANGKTVETNPLVMVKPVVTSVSPVELYAGDENIKVEGTDLDLVVSATLGGNKIDIKEGATDTALELVTTATSVSGKIVLSLANGVTVSPSEEITLKYHSLVVVSEMPSAQHIGLEVVLKGSNFDLVENIFIGETKVTQYSLRTPSEMRFLMPWCKVGTYPIQFKLFSGDVETLATPIEVKLELDIKTAWEGSSYVTWSGGAVTALSWGGYNWAEVKKGTIMTAYFEVNDENAAIRFGNGSWSALPSTKSIPGADGDGNISIAKGVTFVSFALTPQDLAELQNNGGLVICGTGFTITNITLSTEISQEKTIWEGEADPQNYGVNWELGEPDNASWRNAGLEVGQVIRIYFDCLDASDWQIQIFDSHWGGMVTDQYNQGTDDASTGYVTLNVDQSIYDKFTSSQGWGSSIILQGKNVIFTKITLL